MPLRVKTKTRWYYYELYVRLGYVTDALTRKELKLVRELQRLANKHVRVPESEMWSDKRERQAADLAGLQSGELTNDDVNWFAGGVAKAAKIKGDLV